MMEYRLDWIPQGFRYQQVGSRDTTAVQSVVNLFIASWNVVSRITWQVDDDLYGSVHFPVLLSQAIETPCLPREDLGAVLKRKIGTGSLEISGANSLKVTT